MLARICIYIISCIFFFLFRSFVPPVRDEESETQRKAHAKRVRETRRSTQGVTLDEIKSAEQLVKKKQQNNEAPSLTAPSLQVIIHLHFPYCNNIVFPF